MRITQPWSHGALHDTTRPMDEHVLMTCHGAVQRISRYGRLGRVEDIVPLIEFLASPRSQWVTAQTLFINGGFLAR